MFVYGDESYGGRPWAWTPFNDRGELHGVVQTYYPDGRLACIAPFYYGWPHGIVVKFRPDATIASAECWAMGQFTGYM